MSLIQFKTNRCFIKEEEFQELLDKFIFTPRFEDRFEAQSYFEPLLSKYFIIHDENGIPVKSSHPLAVMFEFLEKRGNSLASYEPSSGDYLFDFNGDLIGIYVGKDSNSFCRIELLFDNDKNLENGK